MRGRRESAAPLAWAVSFIGQRLSALSEGDRAIERGRLSNFFGFGAGGDPLEVGFLTIPLGGSVLRLSDAALLELQKAGQEALDQVLALRDGAGQAVGKSKPLTLRWAATAMSHGPVLLQAAGDPTSLFVLKLLFLITKEGADRLIRCPQCQNQKVFWRVGRKKYCSRSCTNRAASGKERG